MSKNRKPTSVHSWMGIAAHEIHRNTACGASKASKRADWLANHVANERNEDLLDLDPRESSWEFWPVNTKCSDPIDEANAAESWISKAAHEIGLITTAAPSDARTLAINLAMHIGRKGLRFMDAEPSKAVCAHFSEATMTEVCVAAERNRESLGFALGQYALRGTLQLAA